MTIRHFLRDDDLTPDDRKPARPSLRSAQTRKDPDARCANRSELQSARVSTIGLGTDAWRSQELT